MEGAAKGNVGGEVRRIHIIYFLSHMGHVEHPHLIRVHHLTRNGVYLRDVKRWLAEVRGKDMPEAFSWSYKRRYKSGYVWQDLMDDDLITPISDNEYVLKGSESIPCTTFDPSMYGKKNVLISRNDQNPIEVEDQHQEQPSLTEETPRTPKTSPEIFEESSLFGSDRSSLTDDSMKQLHEEDLAETIKQNTNEQIEKPENHSSPASFYSSLWNKKKCKNKKTKESNDNNDTNKNNNNDMEKTTTTTGTPADLSFSSSSSSSKSQFAKSKSYSSNGASNMLRNLMKCGAVDTNDAVIVTVNRADKTCLAKSVSISDPGAVICRGEKLGGSARVFGTPWNNNQHQQQNRATKSFDGVTGSKRKSEFGSTKPVSSAYKPVGGPTCSQCGKSFKPEKMHKHMKTCKGMKTLAKTTATVSAEKTPPQRSFNLSPEKSTSGYFLTS
ncbi:Protein UPSTREAM OF FLC [Melia azedarach]|nr:Protein UPSTREAM OF FLC [Melia azedarach]